MSRSSGPTLPGDRFALQQRYRRTTVASSRSGLSPLWTASKCEFVGEVNDQTKSDFLGGARALLFPIDWPEPFGLVMIEAMACGTPVIALPCGSVPEIVTDGETGLIVHE